MTQPQTWSWFLLTLLTWGGLTCGWILLLQGEIFTGVVLVFLGLAALALSL